MGVKTIHSTINLFYFFGKITVKTVPVPLFDVNEIAPSYASIMFFIIGKPKPIPLVFVVNFGSKIKSFTASEIPFPLSETTIFILDP